MTRRDDDRSEADLRRARLRVVGSAADESEPYVWWARAKLEAAGMPPDEIERHETSLVGQPPLKQWVVVDGLLRELRKQRPHHRP